MRLFTGLDLPPDMALRMQQLLATLRPAADVKWSALSNLHITAKFIGRWPEERLDELHSRLRLLEDRPSFEVKLAGMGWFPNELTPRVIWAGVDGGHALEQLASDTDQALFELGLTKDPHPYSPHLTLARIKGYVPLQMLHAKVEELQTVALGQFVATAFHLYSSESGNYDKVHSYPFRQ